jgi:hypothetical protein
MDNEKLKLSTAISIVVHTLAVISLFEVSRRLQEAGRQSGLAWQQGMGAWTFAVVPLYFGVKLLRTPWKTVRSRPGHLHSSIFYLLPPAFWGTILTLIGIVISVYGAIVIFHFNFSFR